MLRLVMKVGMCFLLLGAAPALSQTPTPSLTSPTLNTQKGNFVNSGQEIILNGQKLTGAWSQWQSSTGLQTGVSDVRFWQLFGAELLSSGSPSVQPLRWFTTEPVPTKAGKNYRYLDITALAKRYSWRVQVQGESLVISTAPSQVKSLTTEMQTWKDEKTSVSLPRQIRLELSSPAPVRASFVRRLPPKPQQPRLPDSPDDSSKPASNPDKPTGPRVDEWLITLDAKINPTILGSQLNQGASLKGESRGNQTTIQLWVPPGWRPKLSTDAKPYQITIDIQPEYLVEKEIVWSQQIRWRQKYVTLGNDRFPVVWLEIAPGAEVKPISSGQTQIGTAPLGEIALRWNVSAAINGGFFNRKNQMPLGAIRRDGVWLSSPILGRGVVAWNNKGRFLMGRLHRQETVTTATGENFVVDFINSGYVQAGVSRYTGEWGSGYTPLSDNETVVVVENNRITGQVSPGAAGKEAVPIPRYGYLLVFRKLPKPSLSVGMELSLASKVNPAEFKDYQNILGAGPLLLQQGKVVLDAKAEGFSDAFIQQTASRSVIATTPEGNLILAAVHNRVGGAGITLAELAQLMKQLGAVEALNLDGGSSTGLYLGGGLIDRPVETAAPVHNGLGVNRLY